MPNQELNQRGVPVFRSPVISADHLSEHEAKQLLLLLIDHLNLNAEFTNATKHGDTQLILTPKE